jgi:glycosyltransferase involved in cell wall biosynthesis
MSEQAAPVSCYIRTFNEERSIGRVIAALRGVVSEVVIVDSGSTDATVKIAESHGARIVHQPWLGSGRQKRAGEDQCQHDFVLDLDADEVVTPELAEEIRALFANGSPPRPIYELKLVTVPPVGRPWSNIAVRYSRKLYDRRVVRAPDHGAWDQFKVPEGVEVGRLSGALAHYSFHDLAHRVDKLNRTSTARVKETAVRGLIGLRLRVLFMFPFYFLKHYVMRRHFRAGVYGVAMSITAAFGRWLRDAKMYERAMAERDARRSREAEPQAEPGDLTVKRAK